MVGRWYERNDGEVCKGGEVGVVDYGGAGEHYETGLCSFDKDCSVEA